MTRRNYLPLAAMMAASAPMLANAQTVPPASAPSASESAEPAVGQRYTLADLATLAPRTALDMVSQIPGFTISGNRGGDRGLGAARENVLINGERIADKSTDARTFLARIDANAVRYIDIVDGASLNVPGLTGQVANVVLDETQSRKWTTSLRWTPEIRPRITDNWLNGEISATGPIGGNMVTLSFASNTGREGNWGPERVLAPNGTLLFVRDEFRRFRGDRPRLALTLARTAANGNKLNLNLAGQMVFNRNRVTGTSVQPAIGRVDELFTFDEDEWNANAAADYEFQLGKGRLKLIGQHRTEHSPTINSFTLTRFGSAPTGSRFRQTADEGESILRSEYGWRTAGGTDWQIALEGAYNLLDVDAELALLQPNGTYLPRLFGGERTRVDEKRGEAALTWGRSIAPNLTAQVNLGVEYSQLASSGPGGLSRGFIRPKGRIALAWKLSPKTTINYVLQRRVDQLNFFDFASFVDVANNNGNTGNGRLVPPVFNRTELQLVQDLGAWGNASVTVAYALAENLVDQVPLSPTTEGRGNLPNAHLYRLSSRATLLLDPVGLTGMRINGDITLRRNRVRDPLTNIWRNQSSGEQYEIDLSFRHDIPNSPWAWGATLNDERESADLRLDEINDEFTAGSFVTAFIEHKNVAGFTVRAEMRNITKMRDALDRTIFVDRRTGPVDFIESRRRGFGHLFRLTVTGTL